MAAEDKSDNLSSNLGIFSRFTGMGILCRTYKPVMFIMYMNTDCLLNRNMIKLNYSLDATHVELILN
jgi:hypothetical protein